MIKTRNLTNRDNVNIENCEDEAIHIPGLIQSHGFLLGINRNTLLCEVCSQNTLEYIELASEQLLGRHIEDVFETNVSALLKDSNLDYQSNATGFTRTFAGKEFSFSYFVNGEHYIIEAEPSILYESETVDIYQSSSSLLHSIENTAGIINLANAVVIAIKELTNYHRVMIYRFDQDYNGEVIAEAKESALPPFLGLHYPHTDIPPQARELYLKNQLRLIGDVDYCAIPLCTAENSNIEQVDLSMSSLRSVSPIHLEYLRNMGVKATLTVSLVHRGKLWGLIACHHQDAKFISHAMRSAVKLQGHFITSQIDVRMQTEEYEVSIDTNRSVEQLLAINLGNTQSSIQKLYDYSAIINLCNSIGACAIVGAHVYTHGDTPPVESIKAIGSYLHVVKRSNTFHTDCLSKEVGDLQGLSVEFPGVVFYSLGNDNDCLMWFRKETVSEITWAGIVDKKEDGKTSLSPRKSFAKWSQFVKDRSRPWLSSELSATHNFYKFFQIHLRNIHLFEENEKQRKLSGILEQTRSELDNIKWITTHDFQEPLRKIRMMTSMLVDDKGTPLPDSMMKKIIKVQKSAERMQSLMQAIAKYTKTSNQNQHIESVNLNSLILDIQGELSANLKENNCDLTISDLPTVIGVPFLLAQVFSNILYNAIKFRDHEKQARINITATVENITDINEVKTYHKINIADNGIGFDNQYNKKIFNIFSRLQRDQEYSGTGVGLALCQKILLQHEGFITAQGEVGKGAIFSIYLPKSA